MPVSDYEALKQWLEESEDPVYAKLLLTTFLAGVQFMKAAGVPHPLIERAMREVYLGASIEYPPSLGCVECGMQGQHKLACSRRRYGEPPA